MGKRKLYFGIVSIIAIIVLSIFFNMRFTISNNNLEKQIAVIIKEKILTREILDDKGMPLENNALIEVRDSEQSGLLALFSGYIKNGRRPVQFIISFKKNPLFSSFLLDKVISSSDSAHSMSMLTSYAFVKYSCTVPADSYSITIQKALNLFAIIPIVIFFLSYFFFYFRARRSK